MAVATGLDKRELEVLGVMKDVAVSSTGKFNDALAEWAIDAFQYYLTAGCDEREFVKRVPRLIGILRQELAETMETCLAAGQAAVKDTKAGRSTAEEAKATAQEEIEHTEAAVRLLKRLDETVKRRKA